MSDIDAICTNTIKAGTLVNVRDNDDEEWNGPYILTGFDPLAMDCFYKAYDHWWRYAKPYDICQEGGSV
jgi:hypothetical protein